ncbi:MAG: amidohydrolase family protein, partial [Candidatus Heimdallarchaeota archaeon]|nr:amidohydrolase family protein [Candidatus Heimdallarchaeota archaeon]
KEEIESLIGDETIIIDAADRTVLPGFIDAHTHIAWTGLNKIFLDLRETKSLEDVLDLVTKEIQSKDKGEWIIGRAWDQSNWTNQRYITAADLDPISLENPVLLRHVSGHSVTVNSFGFERLQLSKKQLGVDLNQNGEITGVLRDVDLSDKTEIRPTFEMFVNGLKLGMEEALSLGITSIHDNMTFEVLPAYLHLTQKKELPIRVYGIIYEDMLSEAIRIGLERNFGDKWFRIGACKLMTDGAISTRTAYLYEEYTDKPGEKGFALYDAEKLKEMITRVHENNLQIAVHAIGDKAISNLITAFEENISPEESKKALHRIEHAEILRYEDIKRAKPFGLIFSMQPNFVWRWGLVDEDGMYEQKIGRERTLLSNPFKWVTAEDLLLIFGSDGMPLGPIYGIKGAVFHPSPNLRLSLEDAIKCYTLNPAIASREEDIKGSLVSGKLADIVILNKNLDIIESEEFHDVDVDYTIVGGEIKYKKH